MSDVQHAGSLVAVWVVGFAVTATGGLLGSILITTIGLLSVGLAVAGVAADRSAA